MRELLADEFVEHVLLHITSNLMHQVLKVFVTSAVANFIKEMMTTKQQFQKRVKVYLDETSPLIDYYAKRGKIVEIEGEQDIDKVFADIVKALEV